MPNKRKKSFEVTHFAQYLKKFLFMHNIILRFKKRFVDKMIYTLMVPRRQLRFIRSKF